MTSATAAYPRGLALGDFNADGNLDVVAERASDNTLSVLLGQGDGTFQPPAALLLPGGTLPHARFMGVGDINNDGRLDLAVTAGALPGAPVASGAIHVLLGNARVISSGRDGRVSVRLRNRHVVARLLRASSREGVGFEESTAAGLMQCSLPRHLHHAHYLLRQAVDHVLLVREQ